MKPCLRERKPSLKYKFYDDYESEDSDLLPTSDPTDEDINYCHDCDVLFEDTQCLYKHLLRHITQPKVQIERLTIPAERAPIRITFKGCGSGDFAIVQSPTGALSPLIKEKVDRKGQEEPAGSASIGVRISGKTDDEYEEKYIIPDSDPVAGGSCASYGVETKTEDGHVQEEEEEEEEQSAMNVSFSPNYASAGMMQNHDNSFESQLTSNKITSDLGCGSSIPGAEPTPPPESSVTPDHLMPKIRIKASGLLMAPERESPQGLTITEITEECGNGDQEQMISNMITSPMNNNISSKGADQFGTWSGGPTGLEDPLRLPDTIETDGNIISNLFTNNTDRAKDLGLTSSDSEFISLDGISSDANRNNNNNNAMSVYNANNSATQSSTQSLLPATVSNALVGLPMQQLAQQVSRLQQPQGGQQMHQQNVLINIQQFPQAPQQQQQQQQPPPPQQQQQQVPHMPQQQQQVQPYGMYHQYPPAPYQPQGYGQYGQPYPQPNIYYASAPPPPAYPTPPAQHMPPQTPPQQMQHHQQQPPQAYLLQSAPQQQQQQPQQQPAILGTINQQVQPYSQQQQQQQQPQGQQHQIGYIGAGGQQLQGQYNQQSIYGQPAAQRPPQPNQPVIQGQQQTVGNRMPAPRAPGQVGGPRMGSGGPRGGPPAIGSRAPYMPRGGVVGGRPLMNRGRGGAPMMSMRGRPRMPMNVQQNGIRSAGMLNQQGNSPVKRTSEQMAAIAAKRKRMEALATVKVEADDDEDDCEVVSVQQNERAPLPKIQSVQGAVPETHPDGGGVMHLSDSITLSVRQPPPPPPSPKAKNDAKQVANVLAARGITVTAAPKETKQPTAQPDPVPININSSVCIIQNKTNSGKKEDNTPTVDLTDEVRVPAPKTIPPPNAATTANGQPSTTSTVPPPQPFKCDQCPARYATNIALVKHRQQTHKTCNQMDYGVPLIDLRQPGITTKLTNFGIYNYIPLPAANMSGMFALPVISMNAVRNNVNLSALGSSMLTLGPIRKIQKAGCGPGGTSNAQSPPRGRPPINIASPTKKL